MEDISLFYIILALSIVTVAGMIHGTFGLGFPMVSTPVLAVLTDVQTAILLTLAPNLAVNLYSVIRGGGWSASVGRYWPVAVWMLMGSIVGTLWLVSTDPNPFRLVLAGVLLLYLFSSRFQTLDWWGWMHRHEKPAGAGIGLVAGVLGGIVNVGGPLLVIFFLQLQVAPVVMVQVINLCFLLGKSAQAATFAGLGLFGPMLLLWSLPLGVLAMAGLRMGMAIRERTPVERFRSWLNVLLLVMAALLVIQFFMDLGAG